MKLITALRSATLTPFDALIARDAILAELIGANVYEDAARIRDAVSAEVVAWDAGLEKAALRGMESFAGEAWTAKPCTQLLLLSHAHAVLLVNGEFGAEATLVEVAGVRSPVQFAHAKIRRGQIVDSEDGSVWLRRDGDGTRSLAGTIGKRDFWMQLAALQAFMDLEVVQRESQRLPRQATRAALRSDRPLPKVMVVRLRRIYQERQTGETETEWKHRWMVRGHWRRQWYATDRTHKLIYIAPFIKGPEGKPFLPPRDVVKVVSR